jgi:amino acid permease
MSRRTLTILITLLFVLLALAIFSSERGVAGVLEKIGGTISKLIN